MNNVQVNFETGGSWLARAIRWFTRGRVNHVAITYDSADWKSRWVTEADTPGVIAKPERSRKWTWVVVPKYDAVAHLQVVQQYIGQKYDFQSFFLWIPILLLWRWLKLKVRKPTMSSKAQYCSEYAAHIAIARLGPVVDDPQWVHPEQLLCIFESAPDDYEVRKVEG